MQIAILIPRNVCLSAILRNFPTIRPYILWQIHEYKFITPAYTYICKKVSSLSFRNELQKTFKLGKMVPLFSFYAPSFLPGVSLLACTNNNNHISHGYRWINHLSTCIISVHAYYHHHVRTYTLGSLLCLCYLHMCYVRTCASCTISSLACSSTDMKCYDTFQIKCVYRIYINLLLMVYNCVFSSLCFLHRVL